MAGKYVLTTAKGGKFHFNLYAGNGQVILTSQMYATKAAAEQGIAAVVEHSQHDGRFERLVAKNGKPYFNLQTPDGDTVGTSQMYASQAAMEKGIQSVQNNGSASVVEDDDAADADIRAEPLSGPGPTQSPSRAHAATPRPRRTRTAPARSGCRQVTLPGCGVLRCRWLF